MKISIEKKLRYGKIRVKQVTNKDLFDLNAIEYIKKDKKNADSHSIREWSQHWNNFKIWRSDNEAIDNK